MNDIIEEVLSVVDVCAANKKIADAYMKEHPYFMDNQNESGSTKLLRYLYRVYDHKGNNYYGIFDYKQLQDMFGKSIGTLTWYITNNKLYKGEWKIEKFTNPLY